MRTNTHTQGTVWIIQSEGDGYLQIILSNIDPADMLDSTPLDNMPQASCYRSAAQATRAIAKLTAALKGAGFVVK